MGDSFTEGTGGDTFAGYTDAMSQHLAWRNVTPSGWGGTGYLEHRTPASAAPRSAPATTKDVINAAPDVVIVAGGLNEPSKPPPTSSPRPASSSPPSTPACSMPA